MHARPVLLSLVLFLAVPAARAGEATERYAPAQLRVAQTLFEQARARAAVGEVEAARRLAWQASFDARLAWGMTESTELRAEAAEVGSAASALVTRLTASR
jgi:hypothetical protein